MESILNKVSLLLHNDKWVKMCLFVSLSLLVLLVGGIYAYLKQNVSQIQKPTSFQQTLTQQNGRQYVEQKAVEFIPPKGKTTGPGENGPWVMRLMSATSRDGLNFTRTNKIITDQGDVPDLAVDKNGRIYLYYVGWTVEDDQNKSAVAISEDNGKTWIYKKLGLTGFEGGMASAVDPDIQILEDGTFRLYVTSDPEDGQGPRTYYAEGESGINFTKVGVAFSGSGRFVLDPSTLRTLSGWHFFAGGTGPEKGWHATSTDGKTFTQQQYKEFVKDGKGYIFANAIAIPGGYRAYAFDNRTIVSFFSTDGEDWVAEDGVRLTLDPSSQLETGVLKDPAVVELLDGSYLMVYVTKIP
ncbi:hypothetical protein HY439_00640 [Candidatus Microgenomates bacterium]|nr:hypothetical protein [Candidatus Microgenomates bacterium]